MLDMSWLINSVWTKPVAAVELFQSTGRATGGQWFTKVHFDPPGFPSLVLGDFALDWAWIQLGNPVQLTPDGRAFRPNPERPAYPTWLEGKEVEFRFEQKEFATRFRGDKLYLAPRFLKLKEPSCPSTK